MKKSIKKLVSLVLVALMLCLTACSNSTKTIKKTVNTVEGELSGKTVVLHSNDVHGEIAGYAYMAQAKADFEAKGATVILVDAGDFTQGSVYVSTTKGATAVELMNLAGYDVVTLGNHEFDYGKDVLDKTLKELKGALICSDLFDKNNKNSYSSQAIVKVGDLKIGFFGLLTPETQTKVNPNYVKDVKFVEKEELYKTAQAEVDSLKKSCDLVILLSHLGVDQESLGNQSYDVLKNTTGIDFVIDGHSHTVMEKGNGGEAIQSTGTKFENIGVVVIDNATKKIEKNYLLPTEGMKKDATVSAKAQELISAIDVEYGASIANTQVFLNGTKEFVRSQETNLGDYIADAMVWTVLNAGSLEVADDCVVAVTNGGGIRANLEIGDISMAAINTVLPFGNTVAVNYIKGSELLESLEASTYCTPTTVGGFPQVSGIKFTIDTSVEFDQGEQYPESTYFAPKTIKRVTISEINGKPFSADETYAVVTNNFCAAGGDTYYSFKRAYDAGNGFDTGIALDEAVINFTQATQNGVIESKYAEPQGRIIIK